MNWHFRKDERPLVSIVEAANRTTRRYYIAKELGSFTTTPHAEFLGNDISRIYKYPAMDERTLELYDSLQSLDTLDSVSIEPHEITLGKDWETTLFNRVTATWLPRFDAEVVNCLARHMGWENGARTTFHHQSSSESWRAIESSIGEAVIKHGIKPPKGWPYLR